jgi:SAM-dependent methyltransferase
MAIIQLKSTNPKLSFIIKKNPSSGMLLRPIRKGMAYGWYTDDETFNIYFKDADGEISYKQNEYESFEYLNVSRYNTPLFPLNAINEFFSAPLKVLDERDVEGYEHSFSINMIHIELVRYIDFFDKHLKDVTFEIKHLAHKSYSLTVTTNRSLYYLLHVVSVLCLFLSMFGNEYIDISDSILDKYIKSIHVIDAPFYIRSLFVRHFLSSKERFKKYKAEIEKTARYDIRFDFGSTGLQRRNYIARALSFDRSILDVGCGEGYYAIPFAGKIEGSYYAVDINEQLLETVKRKASTKDIDNISTHTSIDHFLEQYSGEQIDVILTEVIEHMSQDEAGILIQHICRQIDFVDFIITTPNADFNPFYELSGFRHDDHKWEMSQVEFKLWFSDVVKGIFDTSRGSQTSGAEVEVQFEFVAIGDEVNNIRTTQGVMLKKRRV